jgi:hypothetical protein
MTPAIENRNSQFENPLAGTGPDLELDVAPDCSSRDFPLSTFAPPPVAAPALDYKTEMAARLAICDRLLEKIHALKSAFVIRRSAIQP